MQTFQLIKVSQHGYRHLETLPVGTDSVAAFMRLVETYRATRGTVCFVLRDGATGHRTCVAEAFDMLGIPWNKRFKTFN